MKVLSNKMKRLKSVLKQFHEEYFSQIFYRVKQKRLELEALKKVVLSGIATVAQLQEEKVLVVDLMDLYKDEEAFYKQKSRITWLQEGVGNTHFFIKLSLLNKDLSL